LIVDAADTLKSQGLGAAKYSLGAVQPRDHRDGPPSYLASTLQVFEMVTTQCPDKTVASRYALTPWIERTVQ
jgi:hypothetical protein